MYFACAREEFTPEAYKLGIEDEGQTLLIKIPESNWPEVIKALKNKRKNSLTKEFRLREVTYPNPLPWGFGPVFMDTLEENYRAIRCELPQFFSECVHADDTAHQRTWQHAKGVSTSISWLLDAADYVSQNSTPPSNHSQLLQVQLGIMLDRHTMVSAPISAGFSPQLRNWLRENMGEKVRQKISQWMENAYLRMFGQQTVDSFDKHHLGLFIRDQNWITFKCPGDRCDLYPNCTSVRTNHQGWEFIDHNVDTPMQQLTLLIGVASLATLAQKTNPLSKHT